MNHDVLTEMVQDGLTIREISVVTGKSKTSIRYWLKLHGLRTIRSTSRRSEKEIKPCRLCTKPSLKPVCLYCAVRIRRIRLKLASIAYKGGKCNRCGYSKSPWSLEFHHLDGSEKEFGIASGSHNNPWPIVVKELDKCELLCSNCHQDEHGKARNALLSEVMKIHMVRNKEMAALLETFRSSMVRTRD